MFITPFIKILNAEKQDAIPRTWEKDTAARILENTNCICGNPIDSKAKEHLETLANKEKNLSIGLVLDEADKITTKFGTVLLQERFERIRSETIGIQNKMTTAKENFAKICKEIGETVATGFDVEKEENQLEQAESKKTEYENKQSVIKGKVEIKEGELSSKQSKIAKLTKGTKADEFRKLLEQAKKIYEAIGLAITTLVDSKRKMIEKKHIGYFSSDDKYPRPFQGNNN